MMRQLTWIAGLALLMLGCGTPGYTSTMRTNFTGDVPITTHCFRYKDMTGDMFTNHVSQLSKTGWRLAYVSEYTSTSKSKFVYTYCVERALTRGGTAPAADPN